MTNATLKSIDIPLSNVARMLGTNEAQITRTLATGMLGTPPASTSVAKVPLFHIAALLVLQDAEKVDVAADRAKEIISSIAGAAYIRLAQNALRNGRWAPGRGSPARTSELCSLLQSDHGIAILEQQLPCSPMPTKAFAGFSKTSYFTFDKWEEIGELEWPLKVISSASISRRLDLAFPGKLFFTDAW